MCSGFNAAPAGKRRVLFVCVTNLFKSPVAAVLFDQLLKQKCSMAMYEVCSAGTWSDESRVLGARPPIFNRLAKYPYGTNGLRASHNERIHIHEHKAQLLTPDMAEAADVILGVDPAVEETFRNARPLLVAQRKLLVLAGLEPGDGGSFDRHKNMIRKLRITLNDLFSTIVCLAERGQG